MTGLIPCREKTKPCAPARLSHLLLTLGALDVILGSQCSYYYNKTAPLVVQRWLVTFCNPLPPLTPGIYSWFLQSESRSHTHGTVGRAGLRNRWSCAPDRRETGPAQAGQTLPQRLLWPLSPQVCQVQRIIWGSIDVREEYCMQASLSCLEFN